MSSQTVAVESLFCDDMKKCRSTQQCGLHKETVVMCTFVVAICAFVGYNKRCTVHVLK